MIRGRGPSGDESGHSADLLRVRLLRDCYIPIFSRTACRAQRSAD